MNPTIMNRVQYLNIAFLYSDVLPADIKNDFDVSVTVHHIYK